MNNNNFRIAWRNLVKDRQFAFLNLLGLSDEEPKIGIGGGYAFLALPSATL